MEECDYCGASFDDEEAYLRHLRDEHYEELGRIDRRRVDEFAPGGLSDQYSYALIAFGVLAIVGAAGYLLLGGGLGGGPGGGPTGTVDDVESSPLREHGNQTLLAGVQTFPSEGRDHVSSGTQVNYSTMPPTSGPHYGQTTDPGVYTETPPLGRLVHSLEHGGVVIYYDPAAITPEARTSLEEFVKAQSGPWRPVIVAPNPSDDPEAPYVLTAWRTMLRMDSYDAQTVRAFLEEYLGRGPENPVR